MILMELVYQMIHSDDQQHFYNSSPTNNDFLQE